MPRLLFETCWVSWAPHSPPGRNSPSVFPPTLGRVTWDLVPVLEFVKFRSNYSFLEAETHPARASIWAWAVTSKFLWSKPSPVTAARNWRAEWSVVLFVHGRRYVMKAPRQSPLWQNISCFESLYHLMWWQLRHRFLSFASLNGEKLKEAKLQMDGKRKYVWNRPVSNFCAIAYEIIEKTVNNLRTRVTAPFSLRSLLHSHAAACSVSMIYLLYKEIML